MSRDPETMTEAELADWQYEHREDLDADEGEPVGLEVAPQLGVTMSFRLPGAEADVIRAASAAAGMSLSAWIRDACRRAAGAPQPRVEREVVALAQVLESAGLEVRRRTG